MTSFFSAIGSLSYDGPESLGEIFLKIASWLTAPGYLSQRAAPASLIFSQGPEIFL